MINERKQRQKRTLCSTRPHQSAERICQKFRRALEKDVDLVICEMAHFDVSEVSPYLDRCKAKEVWFNHVGYFSTFEEIEALDGKFGPHIKIAHDGDEIIL